MPFTTMGDYIYALSNVSRARQRYARADEFVIVPKQSLARRLMSLLIPTAWGIGVAVFGCAAWQLLIALFPLLVRSF